jgi:hypothetical protein
MFFVTFLALESALNKAAKLSISASSMMRAAEKFPAAPIRFSNAANPFVPANKRRPTFSRESRAFALVAARRTC